MRNITHCIFANNGNGKHFTLYLLEALMLAPILLLAACPDPLPGGLGIDSPPELSAPSAITALALVQESDYIVAFWEEPDNGGSEITAYHLRHSLDGETEWTEIISGIGTSTRYTITGLTADGSYEVQVRAVNAQGDGDWSESATAEAAVVPIEPTVP
ncbi:MAG: fibronectin type III domain-containing protein, partial [Salinispira sp.]